MTWWEVLIFRKTEPSIYCMPVYYIYFNKMKSRKVIVTFYPICNRPWLLCDAAVLPSKTALNYIQYNVNLLSLTLGQWKNKQTTKSDKVIKETQLIYIFFKYIWFLFWSGMKGKPYICHRLNHGTSDICLQPLLSDMHPCCEATFTVFQVHPLHFCTMFCDCVTVPGLYFCSEITVTWSPMHLSSAQNMSLTALCVACIRQFWMLTSFSMTSFMVCNFTIPVTIS